MTFRIRVAAAVAVLLAASIWTSCRSRPDEKSTRLERITLAPRQTRRPVGETQHFTATGHYADGTTRNLTQKVRYASSDPAVARASNAEGNRSRIEALAAGTVTITATDPKTGVSSRAGDGDASFTVLGALERLVLAPQAARRKVGDSQRLTAIGHYAGGVTRNLTQHVVYHSSDPAVAAAPNPDGDKSRIDALAPGSATISAVDSATGVTSTNGNGDATVTVAAK